MSIKMKDFEFYFIHLLFFFYKLRIFCGHLILWLLYFKTILNWYVKMNIKSKRYFELLQVFIFENRENLVSI